MEKDITKRLSKSKLNTFKDCAKKYWFSIHYREEQKEVPVMIRGNKLHNLFEDFYEKYKGHLCRSKDEVIELLNTINNNQEFKPQIEMFAQWTEMLKFPQPESCEQKIYSEKQDIVIKWDRIDYDGINRVIWDYKTGNYYSGQQFNEKFEFELLLYAFIYMLETKKRVNYVGIYFIDHGKQMLIKVNDEKIKKAMHEIFELKLEMYDYQKQNIWPEKVSYKCHGCQWNHMCDKYKEVFNK